MLLQTNQRWDLAEISRRHRTGQRRTPCISRFRGDVPGYGITLKNIDIISKEQADRRHVRASFDFSHGGSTV